MGKRYRGAILNPLSRDEFEFIRSGFLDVNDDGRIDGMGDLGEPANEEDFLIIPAFVDVHTHLPQLM